MLPIARQHNILMQEVGDDIVLYDSQNHRYHTLNRTASLIWLHCDGTTSVTEMVAILQKRLHIMADESLVYLTLKQLHKAQLLVEQPVVPPRGRYTRREAMVRFGALSALLLPAVFTLTACGSASSSSGGGPQGYQAQLDKALATWNSQYGKNVQLVGFVDFDKIDSVAKLNQVADELANIKTTWLPTGSPSDPSTVSAARIADDPTITPAQIAAYEARVKALLQVGQVIMLATWSKSGQTFTTLLIRDANNVIYDSILSNFIITQAKRGVTCVDFDLVNLFGFTVGNINAQNTPSCDSKGQRQGCDFSCSGTLSVGSCECKGKSTPSGTLCCQLSYSWAYATGFKSIEVGADNFTLKITGYLGSSGQGNGACTACCSGTGSSGSSP